MPALRLDGIEKTYPNGQAAVAGVDLEVSDGEMVVLLGPSGCGKSTLLRVVAGIEAPTRGRVFIGGQDVTDLPPQKRDIAMVFQNYALYPHMTVRENLAFGLRMRGLGGSVVARRVAEVAESLGMAALLERRPSQLSGGQRQRVALGRAIARQAKVFLLDEPLSNLDVQLRVNTRTELARLHRTLAVPMLYVTHDQEEAMTLGDRVVVMHSGRFLQVGAPMEIYRRPATQFVGGFVGSPRMNFFPARLEPLDGESFRVHALGAVLELKPAPGQDVHGVERTAAAARPQEVRAREVVVGIRPEDIEIVSAPQADLLARADVVEPLGRELLLHLALGDDPSDALPDFRVLAAADAAVGLGTTIGLRLRRERIHLFDSTTEARLAGFD